MELTFFEASAIRVHISKMSYEKIAVLINRSSTDVELFAKEYLQGKSIIPFQNKSIKEKENKKLKQSRKLHKKDYGDGVKFNRPEKTKQTVFETKNIDLSKMHMVKVDNKTSILIPIGSNVKEEIEKYKKRIAVPKPTVPKIIKPVKQTSNVKRDKNGKPYPSYFND